MQLPWDVLFNIRNIRSCRWQRACCIIPSQLRFPMAIAYARRCTFCEFNSQRHWVCHWRSWGSTARRYSTCPHYSSSTARFVYVIHALCSHPSHPLRFMVCQGKTCCHFSLFSRSINIGVTYTFVQAFQDESEKEFMIATACGCTCTIWKTVTVG